MASHDSEKDLPQTWPFTFGSLLVLVAMSWFCLGFAVGDVGDELPAFFEVFWSLIAAGVVIIAGGAVVNIRRDHARRAG